MRFLRIMRTALVALSRNPMRAALTVLGIVIGVAAVIAVMEIGNGSSQAISQSIASLGANVLIVLPGAAASGGISFGAGSNMTLSPDDCDAILQQCPAVRAAAPVVRARGQVVYGNKNWVPMEMDGTTPAFLVVRDWTHMAEGDLFSDQDVRNGAMVCVIGQSLAKNLFAPNESPVGQDIRVLNVSLKVVGVLGSKGANMMGRDQDDILLAPWTTIKYRVSGSGVTQQSGGASSSTSSAVNSLNQLYPSSQLSLYPQQSATQAADTPLPVRFANVDSIMAAARSSEDIPLAMKQITDLLRERHRITYGELDDFNIRDQTEFLNTITKTQQTVILLLYVVAAISLVVGGVGIMNIMLVSVTERTREIGLRMAVGARGLDILRQFLTEAVVLCLLGGTIGILIGRLTSFLVTYFMHWPIEISVGAIIFSIGTSALVGVSFGFYPAWKASRLDPIEALRYE